MASGIRQRSIEPGLIPSSDTFSDVDFAFPGQQFNSAHFHAYTCVPGQSYDRFQTQTLTELLCSSFRIFIGAGGIFSQQQIITGIRRFSSIT